MSYHGFNMRDTFAYVTERAGQYGVHDNAGPPSPTHLYPQTGGDTTFGWESAVSQNDREVTTDPELAGIAFRANSGAARAFRVDLPEPGDYLFRLAAGDAGAGQAQTYVQLKDDENVLFTLDEAGHLADEFWDASATLRTKANWFATNEGVVYSFPSGIARIYIAGQPVAPTGNTTLAHVSFELIPVSGGVSRHIRGAVQSIICPVVESLTKFCGS